MLLWHSLCGFRGGRAVSHPLPSIGLEDVGMWKRGVGTCASSSLVHDVRNVCLKQQNANIADLSKQWRDAHKGIPKATPKKIRGLAQTRCHNAGVCLVGTLHKVPC